jgi:hypothetical protein
VLSPKEGQARVHVANQPSVFDRKRQDLSSRVCRPRQKRPYHRQTDGSRRTYGVRALDLYAYAYLVSDDLNCITRARAPAPASARACSIYTGIWEYAQFFHKHRLPMIM